MFVTVTRGRVSAGVALAITAMILGGCGSRSAAPRPSISLNEASREDRAIWVARSAVIGLPRLRPISLVVPGFFPALILMT